MLLFICGTPLQIFNVVNLATTTFRNEVIDVYILDHANSNYNCYLELRKHNIFNNVYYIKSKTLTGGNSTIKIFRYIKTAKHFINSKIILSQLEKSNVKYDSIFISTTDVASQIIYYYYKNKFNSTKLFMYEDGILLTCNYFYFKTSQIKKFFIKILFRRDIINEYSGVYVYKPDFLITDKSITINKLPTINKDDVKTLSLLNNIMGYKDYYSKELNSKYVFFEQAFQFQNAIDKEVQLLEFIIKYTGLEDIVVKLHPRTDKNSYDRICRVSQVPVPYEIIELNNIVENKVLISIISTACLNPKIIFDEEPYVILLFKLIDLFRYTPLNITLYDTVYKIKNSYRDPNRFFIPETLKDLEEALNYLDII